MSVSNVCSYAAVSIAQLLVHGHFRDPLALFSCGCSFGRVFRTCVVMLCGVMRELTICSAWLQFLSSSTTF